MYFFAFIYIVNPVVSGDIYTTFKNFTLPPAVTALTNFNSAGRAALIVVSWDPGWEETILNEVSLGGPEINFVLCLGHPLTVSHPQCLASSFSIRQE